jgi:hypothetical protein
VNLEKTLDIAESSVVGRIVNNWVPASEWYAEDEVVSMEKVYKFNG